MGQVSRKLRSIGASKGLDDGGFAHFCPACDEMHGFAINGPNENGAVWKFSGTLNAPTFTPSMLIKCGELVCHYILTDGKVRYLNDCTHEYANKTIDIPDLPNYLQDIKE